MSRNAIAPRRHRGRSARTGIGAQALRSAIIEVLEGRRLLSGVQYWTMEEAQTAADLPRDADGTWADHLVHEYDRAGDRHLVADYSQAGGGGDMDFLDGFLQTQGYDGLGDLLQTLGDPKEFFENLDENDLSGQNSVFGNDDRIQVGNTTAFPFRTIGRVATGGSGAMISPFHVLTAGHVVHSGVNGTPFYQALQVTPGQADANNRPYGEADWTWVRSYTNWTQGGDWNHDWAVITLDRNIGNFTGWMGKEWAGNNNHYNGTTVNLSGYPADKPQGTQWFSSGPITDSTGGQFRYNGTLDTFGGHSGSPVWRFDGTNRYIVGIHAYGDSGDGFNRATRLTQGKFNDSTNWVNEDFAVRPPTDRPDLLDYDDWFATNNSSVTPGVVAQGSGFSSTFLLRNNGTANSNNAVINFYASTNNVISTADTFLGSVTAGSVAALGQNWVTLNGTIPSGLATGNYYIGWIIDANNNNVEYRENNNTGYHNSQIVVTQGAQPDYFESNDTLAGATNFETLFDRSHPGLSIHSSADNDYYRFSVGDTGTLNISLAFQHSQGDVDMHLLDEAGNLLASSTGVGNSEFITRNVFLGETFVVRVYGYQGATNPSYAMTLDGPATPADVYEPNNSFGGAYDLGPTDLFQNADILTVHEPGNDDYYRFTALADGQVYIEMNLPHADGDLDMQLFDGDGTLLQGSYSTSDVEVITADVVAGQEYVLQVYGYQGDLNWYYALLIDGPADAQPPSVLSAEFRFQTGQAVAFAFDEDVSASLDPADLVLFNLTTGQPIDASDVAVAWDAGTNTASFTFPGLPNGTLPNGNYEATLLAAGVTDTAGNPLTGDYVQTFFFLQADANRDRAVNLADFGIVRANFGQSGRTFSQGDFNYDGTVNLADFGILRSRFGNTLPPHGGDLFNGGGGGDDDGSGDDLLA